MVRAAASEVLRIPRASCFPVFKMIIVALAVRHFSDHEAHRQRLAADDDGRIVIMSCIDLGMCFLIRHAFRQSPMRDNLVELGGGDRRLIAHFSKKSVLSATPRNFNFLSIGSDRHLCGGKILPGEVTRLRF